MPTVWGSSDEEKRADVSALRELSKETSFVKSPVSRKMKPIPKSRYCTKGNHVVDYLLRNMTNGHPVVIENDYISARALRRALVRVAVGHKISNHPSDSDKYILTLWDVPDKDQLPEPVSLSKDEFDRMREATRGLVK